MVKDFAYGDAVDVTLMNTETDDPAAPLIPTLLGNLPFPVGRVRLRLWWLAGKSTVSPDCPSTMAVRMATRFPAQQVAQGDHASSGGSDLEDVGEGSRTNSLFEGVQELPEDFGALLRVLAHPPVAETLEHGDLRLRTLR